MGGILFTEEMTSYSPEGALREFANSVSHDIEFRSAHHPDECVVDIMTVGKCVKKYDKFSKSATRKKQIDQIANSHCPNTNEADYINAGQIGYYRLEAKVDKNNKRGKSYVVATTSLSSSRFNFK